MYDLFPPKRCSQATYDTSPAANQSFIFKLSPGTPTKYGLSPAGYLGPGRAHGCCKDHYLRTRANYWPTWGGPDLCFGAYNRPLGAYGAQCHQVTYAAPNEAVCGGPSKRPSPSSRG